jgi:predicted ATPase
MKFNFEKLGGIDSGSIALGDLTIICGPNNVGKTYISYAIYGLIRHFKQWIDLSISADSLSELREQGTLVIELQDYQKKLGSYLKKASSEFSRHLPRYFNVPDEFFSDTRAEFSHDQLQFDFSYEYKESFNFGQLEQLSFYKSPEESLLSITFQTSNKSKVPNRILDDVISDSIAECLFSKLLPKPFVVTSERTGIALFYKELDISKNAILEHISNTDKVDPLELLNSMRSRYAQPIHDNINVIRDYETYSKRKSFIRDDKERYFHITESLQELMGGSYKLSNKQLMFMPKKERNRDKVSVPVYVASSSIKSLFLIDLYVNSFAEEKGMLIIDEPELNLHPDNQRKMAGLLARLVNAGVKVLVTTHSDYLIRELNNRIMLHQDFPEKEEIMKSAKLNDYDLLKVEQVKAYIVGHDHSIQEIGVDKFGMNLKIFDELIAEANELSDRIYYSLEDVNDD